MPAAYTESLLPVTIAGGRRKRLLECGPIRQRRSTSIAEIGRRPEGTRFGSLFNGGPGDAVAMTSGAKSVSVALFMGFRSLLTAVVDLIDRYTEYRQACCQEVLR
jgi:hypothetical protein